MASISTPLSYSPSIFTSIPPVRLKPPDSLLLKTQTLHKLSFKSPSPKTPIGFSVKATADVTKTMGIRPGSVVETDKLPSDVRNRAMEAVDACGGRVTIGDVASRAGLKLNEAQKALQALASDTDGFLEVSDEGDVLYVFPKDYRSKLAAKSLRLKFEPLYEKGKAAAEYLIRVSFGTALIASIVIVYTHNCYSFKYDTGIIGYSDENDQWGVRHESACTVKFGITVYKHLFGDCTGIHITIGETTKTDGGDKMNFIESVFSFVFGDGDPNQGIEKEVEVGNTSVLSSVRDESYILPVLLRFDGKPEIDEEGNILYQFPSLQRTASSKRSGRKEYVGKRWADWVGGVGEVFQRENMAIQGHGITQNGGFIKFVSSIFPLLQIYAGSFFAIPLIRWFLVLQKNAEIENRNRAREQCAQMLELPDISLRRR
ncbi:hypothetical protein POTOM_060929 [Populus tomentosa]|uniref:Iron-sulfur cluster biosynthesis family protein n=1 Tax=Populus tomentosa TaxID=118781 RepID=A0A8X8BVN3_POPTO|nr:hypothetical protein POTOM_060929 [Populus tomentosa]